MKIKSEIWANALIGSLQDNINNSNTIVKNFIKKLSGRRQAKLIPTILRQINKIENYSTIQITSSHLLSEQTQAKIVSFSHSLFSEIKNPKYKYQIDNNIIGGIKLNSRDNEFDASVAHNIDTIKEQLWR